MRKILLGTTAVVGAALFAPAAFAQAPVTSTAPSIQTGAIIGTQTVQAPSPALAAAGGLTVRLGGYFNVEWAYLQDDGDRSFTRNTQNGVNNANARQRQDIRNDWELYVDVEGRVANGLVYGAHIEVQNDNVTGTAGDTSTLSLDEAWGFIRHASFGEVRYGSEDSAASLLQVRAPGSGVLGTDGDWYDFVVSTGVYSTYILSGINDGNDASKVIYLSPQFAGFDFGLSYAPNSGEGPRRELGASTTIQQRDRTSLEDEFSGAIRYRGTFGPVGVIAGLGAMTARSGQLNTAGQALNPRGQTVTAYTGGLVFTGYGFSVGGEYTFGQYNGSSVGRTALAPGLDDSYHFNLGITYTLGPVVFGGVFGQGKQDNGTTRVGTNIVSNPDRTHTVWGVGVLYNLAPGLGLFALYQNVNDENVPVSAPSDARYGGGGTTLATFGSANNHTRTINIGMIGVTLGF